MLMRLMDVASVNLSQKRRSNPVECDMHSGRDNNAALYARKV